MKKVVLLSGGIDSTTCLAIAASEISTKDILAVNMFYGQRHKKEIEAARNVASHYAVELMELDLADIFQKSDCSLLEGSKKEVPYGAYAEQQKELKGKPVSTYVPFRNGLMLSAAASIAMSIGADSIYYGAHADDSAGNAYPDCSVAFTRAINEAIQEGTAGAVKVIAPLNEISKTDVVRLGLALKAPYHLTWSCYKGGETPCGKCGTCIDRAKAFEANGIEDPALSRRVNE